LNSSFDLRKTETVGSAYGLSCRFIYVHKVQRIRLFVTDNYMNDITDEIPTYAPSATITELFFHKYHDRKLPEPFNPCTITDDEYRTVNCRQK
jgi:hypothetical protein